MVHREGSGEAELHEFESDVIVVSGAGTMIVGGTMPVILHIPPKTAHQVVLGTRSTNNVPHAQSERVAYVKCPAASL